MLKKTFKTRQQPSRNIYYILRRKHHIIPLIGQTTLLTLNLIQYQTYISYINPTWLIYQLHQNIRSHRNHNRKNASLYLSSNQNITAGTWHLETIYFRVMLRDILAFSFFPFVVYINVSFDSSVRNFIRIVYFDQISFPFSLDYFSINYTKRI